MFGVNFRLNILIKYILIEKKKKGVHQSHNIVILFSGSVTCPVISSEDISRECNSRTEHLCLSDSECGGSRRSKCCPSSRNGGCSLMCVEPRALGEYSKHDKHINK